MAEALISRALEKTHFDDATVLRTLNAFAVDVMAIRSAEDLFWYVAQNVVGRLNFVDCVIYRAEGSELIQSAALGEKNPYGRTILNPLRIPFGKGITGRVAEIRQAIIVDDLLDDCDYIPDAQPARSEICVPLISQGRVVGVIDSEHPDVGAFGPAELEILTTVAAMTSAKLELLTEAEISGQRYRNLVEAHAQLTREVENRKALQAELLEARRMEAIGRLTGDFAHGFNNLLTVISGNLELLELCATDLTARLHIGEAKSASQRGSRLIQNMLSFAERAQLDPKPVDINNLIRSSCERECRTEGGDITCNLSLQPWSVRVDPVAVEVALSNLILNARDAMPDGGKIVIESENVFHDPASDPALAIAVGPGQYVRVTVTDEGHGIAPERLPRIFDPFYTTKPIGEGIGLGLSMVMGFMKQSGGWVRARSDPGHGTSVELYFPVISELSNS